MGSGCSTERHKANISSKFLKWKVSWFQFCLPHPPALSLQGGLSKQLSLFFWGPPCRAAVRMLCGMNYTYSNAELY